MKLRSIFPLMLLAMQPALMAEETVVLLEKGNDALASGLWEIAARHFGECMEDPDLSPDEKPGIAMRLAESWIREGKPVEALKLLGEPFAVNHPEAPYWKGLALAGLGRFSEAVTTLTPLLANPDAPHHTEAGFTMASLQLSLAQADEAIETLALLARSNDPALSATARLHQVEVLLDLGRVAEAREIMPDPTAIAPANQALAAYLNAQLLLREDRFDEAAAGFRTLIDQPQGQSLYRYHSAAVGLTDALNGQGNREQAVDFLLDFIQENPESPQLVDMFKRLLDWLPETPAVTDPILDRLPQWITPPALPITGLIETRHSGAAAAWPVATNTNDLLAFSLFTRAIGLHRSGTPEARDQARRLMTRFRLENPDHYLANRALFETARWALEDGSLETAFNILETLRENANSPATRGQASFLQATIAYDQGQKEQAIKLFEAASESLLEDEARAARLNAALVRLAIPETPEINALIQKDLSSGGAIAADLELERALTTKSPDERRAAIEEFLTNHPRHPRVPEARLAAAETSLTGVNPDLSFAKAQLDTLAADPQPSSEPGDPRMAMIRLRIQDLSKDSAAAIATAQNILEEFPNDPAASDAAFLLGRNLFQVRNYNDARLVLEKLATSESDSARAQAAWLLAARSAALVPTSQSQQEALTLFDKAIEPDGSLSSIARLEKGRLMIDMNRLPEAIALLRTWFESLPADDPLHLPAGLLLGEAIYAQGTLNPMSLTGALEVYDRLLLHTDRIPVVYDRLQYLRGRTLEQIPDAKDPTQKREKEALAAYYSVLETTAPPLEWYYFELCGFRALALLEKAGRWEAAMACAKKIASFNGPRAEEAASRASQIQLKHFIYED